jgi:hypothetical protein
MATVIKPKPGKYQGIEFRSQLEIKWAKWLSENCPDKWSVVYVDDKDCDFASSYHSPNAPWHYMEVKPPVADPIRAALMRLRFSDRTPGESWTLLVGQPPSAYGRPWCLQLDFITTSEIYGPFTELSAVATCNFLNNDRWPLGPENVELFDSCVITEAMWLEEIESASDGGVSYLIDGLVEEIGHRSGLDKDDSWG